MSNEVSWVFSLQDRFSDPLRKMIDSSNDFKKSADELEKKWNTLNNKKLTLKYDDLRKAKDELKNTKKDAEDLGVSFDGLYKQRAAKVMQIENDLKQVNTQISETTRGLKDLEKQASKTDNNMASRSGGKKDSIFGSGSIMTAGFGAMLGGQINSMVANFASNFLPNSLNSALNGAISGFFTGLPFGPAGAVIGGISGGITSFVGAEAKKNTDRAEQRIQFGSNMIQQLLPQIATGAIDYASNLEQTKIGFKTMLGGEDEADAFIKHLQGFAQKTPFEFTDLTDASKKMLAYGFKAEEITPTLTSIGDAASGLSMGKEGIDALTTAIGRMKVSGKVTLEYLNPMIERGVGVWEILKKATGKEKEELQDMVSRGLLPANETILALINGMEEKFPNMMKEQSGAFEGLLSTIKDGAKQLVLGPLGSGFIDGIKPAMERFVEFFDLGSSGFADLQEDIKTFGREIGTFVGGAIETVQNTFSALFNDERFKNQTLPEKFMTLLRSLKIKADEWYTDDGYKLIDALSGYFSDIMTEVGKSSPFIDAVQKLWLSIAPDSDTMKAMLGKSGLGWLDWIIQESAVVTGPVYPPNVISAGAGMGPISPVLTREELTSMDLGAMELPPSFNSKFNGEATSALARSGGRKPRAFGTGRIPYDGYPIAAHEGEKLLTRVEADAYERRGNAGGTYNISIGKLTDSIVLSDAGQPAEEQAYRFAELFVQNVCDLMPAYGGV